MRYERKYRIEDTHLSTIIQVIKNHPATFRKIYPDRQINNIYWDTVDFQFLKENIVGIAEREKVRVRWYGEQINLAQQAKLEIKKRINELGTKDIFDVTNFQLAQLSALSKELTQFIGPNKKLLPVLLNSYKRAYYGTTDQKFRITIDTHMQFHTLYTKPNFLKYHDKDDAIILELKYDQEYDELSNRITQYIPFRKTKNSKYVKGMSFT